MNCEQIRTWLIDFADHNLDQETSNNVREHLKACETCRQDLEEIEILFKELNNVQDETPPASVKEEFRQMLSAEMLKSETDINGFEERETGSIRVRPTIGRSRWFQVAAVVILLIAGALIDRLVFTTSTQSGGPGTALTGFQREMEDFRSLLVANLTDSASPSVRIRTIDSIRYIEDPDPEIIKILFTTLNRDRNVNVRFAAAQTLAQFLEDDQIRMSLIESLAIQDEPLIQITLLNYLVAMGETRAVNVIKKLMYNQENPDIVRKEASKGINILES